MKGFVEHSKLLLILVSVLLIQVVTSCVNESGSCDEPKVDSKDKVYLRFTVMTTNDGSNSSKNGEKTRSADIEGGQIGSALENTLNIDDISYYLFDENRGFLQDISPKSETIVVTTDYKIYNVVSEIDEEYFGEHISGAISFYIVAFANYTDWGTSIKAPSKGESIERFLVDNSGVVLTQMPDTRKLRRTDEYWQLYPGGSYFPMAGMQKFTVQGSMLAVSSKNAPYDISLATGKDLNLLRSLVKIEIIDKINIKDKYDEEVDGDYFNDPGMDDSNLPNSWLRIHKVEINGVMNQGTLFPSVIEWTNSDADETQQVDLPTIPSSATYYYPVALNEDNSFGTGSGASGNLVDFYPDMYATNLREDKCPVFSGYLFEYYKLSTQLENIPITQQPYFRITTRGHTKEDGSGLPEDIVDAESMVLPVRMAEYKNGAASASDNLDYLLRNHIYRFEISGISQDIQVKWTVCEMDNLKSDIIFN